MAICNIAGLTVDIKNIKGAQKSKLLPTSAKIKVKANRQT